MKITVPDLEIYINPNEKFELNSDEENILYDYYFVDYPNYYRNTYKYEPHGDEESFLNAK